MKCEYCRNQRRARKGTSRKFPGSRMTVVICNPCHVRMTREKGILDAGGSVKAGFTLCDM